VSAQAARDSIIVSLLMMVTMLKTVPLRCVDHHEGANSPSNKAKGKMLGEFRDGTSGSFGHDNEHATFKKANRKRCRATKRDDTPCGMLAMTGGALVGAASTRVGGP
jgi:hypothetical protein